MYYGRLVRVRAPEMRDLNAIMKHLNTYETRKFIVSLMPISENAEREWLERATTLSPWRDGHVELVIEDKYTDELIGNMGLHGISPQDRCAEVGIFIHNPENCGKGYGTDALRVLLWIAFHVLGLECVYLHYVKGNDRARRAYEKAGFKHAGVYRKRVYKEGEFHDLVAMDILREEFMQQYPPGTMVGERPQK